MIVHNHLGVSQKFISLLVKNSYADKQFVGCLEIFELDFDRKVFQFE